MDKDTIAIINILSKRTLITVNELEEKTESSKRQLAYRIKKINELLKAKKLPLIAVGYNKDIIVQADSRKYLNEILKQSKFSRSYFLNKEERLAYIYFMLFINLDYLTLQHFIDALKVSRSTVLSDFKDLTLQLERSGIGIQNNRTTGYHLLGNEMDIRRYMMTVIIETLSSGDSAKVFDLFISKHGLDDFKVSKDIISSLAAAHDILFVEDRLAEFIYIFIILKARMLTMAPSLEEELVLANMELMKSLKEFLFTLDLLTESGCIDKVQGFDINYISAWILGISVGNANDRTKDHRIISEIVESIMTRFESLSGVHYENYDYIFKQIFAHFRPAYYRLLFRLPVINPLCRTVKAEYSELYCLVSETMKPFSGLFGEEIPEDEVAYLSLHFATIFAEKKEQIYLEKKKALIVCSNGIGSSAILYNELTSLFPELQFYLPIEASRLNSFKQPVQIIFTTKYHLEDIDSEVPLIKVSPVMTAKEKYRVRREVHMLLGNTHLKQPSVDEVLDILKKYTTLTSDQMLRDELISYFYQIEYMGDQGGKGLMLSEVTNESLIQLKLEAVDWEDAIRKSAQIFLDQDICTPNYVDEIISASRETGPYIVITKHVALPHARPEAGAKKLAIGISTLKTPIEFGNKQNDPVKYIFCLSAKDNESHLRSMAELVELLEQEAFYKVLDNANDPKEIINFIKKHES